MNKYFIHKPKIKIIYIVGLRSLLAKKSKTPHYYTKNERSSQSLIFYLEKIKKAYYKISQNSQNGGAAENCPRVQKVIN